MLLTSLGWIVQRTVPKWHSAKIREEDGRAGLSAGVFQGPTSINAGKGTIQGLKPFLNRATQWEMRDNPKSLKAVLNATSYIHN